MDKTRLEIGGKNIIQYQHGQLSRHFNEIIISLNSKSKSLSLQYSNMVPDEIRVKGPLIKSMTH